MASFRLTSLFEENKIFLSRPNRHLFCNAYILPRIDYCCNTWGHWPETHKNSYWTTHKRLCSLNTKRWHFHYLRRTNHLTKMIKTRIESTISNSYTHIQVTKSPCSLLAIARKLPDSEDWEDSVYVFHIAIIFEDHKNGHLSDVYCLRWIKYRNEFKTLSQLCQVFLLCFLGDLKNYT